MGILSFGYVGHAPFRNSEKISHIMAETYNIREVAAMEDH